MTRYGFQKFKGGQHTGKKIVIIHYSKRMKDNKHVIISSDAQSIQNPARFYK